MFRILIRLSTEISVLIRTSVLGINMLFELRAGGEGVVTKDLRIWTIA